MIGRTCQLLLSRRDLSSVAGLSSATSLTQLIALLVAPVLTRVYTPADYAILALLTAISGPVGLAANGRYDLALFAEKEVRLLPRIALASLALAFATTAVLGLVWAALAATDCPLRILEQLGSYAYFLPLQVILTSATTTLLTYATRSASYSRIGLSEVARGVATVAVQVLLALAMTSAYGLILGLILGSLIQILLLLGLLVPSLRGNRPRLSGLRDLLVRYRRFPQNYVLISLLNAGAATTLTLGFLYSDDVVGNFGLAWRTLTIPGVIVTGGLLTVLTSRLAATRSKPASALQAVDRSLRALTPAGVAFAAVMVVAGPQLYSFFFGLEWRTAGEFARWLCLFFAVGMVTGAIANVPSVYERQRLALSFESAKSLVPVATGVAAGFGDWSPMLFVATVSLLSCALLIAQAMAYRRIVSLLRHTESE